MRGNPLHWIGEIPLVIAAEGAAGRSEKVSDLRPGCTPVGSPDGCAAPKMPPDKDGLCSSAKAVERRRQTEGNTLPSAVPRTLRRTGGSIGLQRVREAARRDRRARFTALPHYSAIDLLRESCCAKHPKSFLLRKDRRWRDRRLSLRESCEEFKCLSRRERRQRAARKDGPYRDRQLKCPCSRASVICFKSLSQ
jgi:RNA-directed DNA polymerase